MPKYIVMSPVKAGKRGEPVLQPGAELEIGKDAAAPMLAAGTIATPKDAARLQEMQGASQSTAALLGRISELETALEGLAAHNAELAGHVSDLTAQLQAKPAASKGAEGGKTPEGQGGAGGGKGGGGQAGMAV